MNKTIKVTMVGSDPKEKGGISTVINNILSNKEKLAVSLNFVKTHSTNKIKTFFAFVTSLAKIKKQIKKGKVDLLYLHMSQAGSFRRKQMIIKIANQNNIPYIIHHHGSTFEKWFSALNKNKKESVIGVLCGAKTNIVLGEKNRKMMFNIAPKAKIRVLYNSIGINDNNLYNPDSKLLLFLGRIGERKGAFDLLHVCCENSDFFRDHGLKMFFAGDGKVEQLTKQAKQKKIDDFLVIRKWVSNHEKKELFTKTICSILPSYREGLSMFIIESMSYGIPCIATDVGSMNEAVIDGLNGFMVAPGDCNQIFASIKKIVDDRELRKSFSNQAYLISKNKFNLSNWLFDLSNILLESLTH